MGAVFFANSPGEHQAMDARCRARHSSIHSSYSSLQDDFGNFTDAWMVGFFMVKWMVVPGKDSIFPWMVWVLLMVLEVQACKWIEDIYIYIILQSNKNLAGSWSSG